MSTDPKTEIAQLKYVGDLLKEFNVFLGNLASLEQKHGMQLDSIKNSLNITDGVIVEKLGKVLTLEKLGMLFLFASELQGVIGDINNYFTLDKIKQEETRRKLTSAIEKFDKVIAGV